MGRGRRPVHDSDCTCQTCNQRYFARQNRQGSGRRNNGGWTPRYPGTLASGEEVTFRQGLGDNEGHTLISDGQKSAGEFNNEHNHYGQNREGDGGRVEDGDGDRGFYTGPGH